MTDQYTLPSQKNSLGTCNGYCNWCRVNKIKSIILHHSALFRQALKTVLDYRLYRLTTPLDDSRESLAVACSFTDNENKKS